MSPETAAAMLEADRDRLREALRHQRRLRIAGLGDDPLDGDDLRRVWNECAAVAAVSDELLDPTDTYRPTDGDDAAVLDQMRPGLGALYLDALDADREARAEADRLQALPDRKPADEPSLARWALLATPGYGAPEQRRRALLRLAGHLLAFRVDVGTALGLLEAWDQQRNQPPLGPEQVEDAVRWIARRQLQQGRAA